MGKFERDEYKNEPIKDYKENIFWAWKKDENEKWGFNADYKECALKYLSLLTNNRSKFIVKIEVEHWCDKDEKSMSTHQLSTFWEFEVDQNDVKFWHFRIYIKNFKPH